MNNTNHNKNENSYNIFDDSFVYVIFFFFFLYLLKIAYLNCSDLKIGEKINYCRFKRLFKRKIKFKKLNRVDTDEICSICLLNFEEIDINNKELSEADLIVKLNCEHLYHLTCIKQWYNESIENKCPQCRNNILVKEYLI